MKWLKRIGIVLGGLIIIVLITAVALQSVGKSKLDNAPDVASEPVTIPTEAAAIARGEHIAQVVSSCTGCHGDNLAGEPFFENEMGLTFAAPNLTSGAGGTADFTDANWERAIRHGIGRDGRVLAIMPSDHFQYMSDDDLGALVAYLKSLPPVDNDLGPRHIGFPGGLVGGIVAFDDFTKVNHIDHAAVGTTTVPAGPTAGYGHYMIKIAACSECHGPDMAGLPPDADSPDPGPNLTPGGELGGWDEAGFIQTIRTGTMPGGRRLDGDRMPWEQYSQMSDTELQAIWAYLSSLPAVTAGGSDDGG